DDHRGFIERMRAMARTAVLGGLALLLLVLTATVLSVTFATRGAMVSNRPVIEVLFFIGAKTEFIAARFQQRFLMLGLPGGLLGGGAAIALFVAAEVAGRWFSNSAGGDQLAALFGAFSLGVGGYIVVLALIGLIALATALAARITVNRMLDALH